MTVHPPTFDKTTTSPLSPGRSPKRPCFKGDSFAPMDSSDTASHPEMQMSVDGQAARACEKCRASKRKCDKKLPFCDRCKRLNAKCHYVQDPIANNPNGHGAQFVLLQPQTLSNDLFRGSEPLEGISASQILSLVSPGGTQGEPHVDWRYAIRLFFYYVHPWFAVVHPNLFHQKLTDLLAVIDSPSPPDSHSSLGNGHDDQMDVDKTVSIHQSSELLSKELALLIVAMYLVTRMRLTDSGEQLMFDETYRTVKRMLSILLMGCAGDPEPGIEIIQCGALIALYEYGHGDAESAYRTLSQAAATARIMDIKPGQMNNDVSADNVAMSSSEEQGGCLWWGMFILEQFIHAVDDTRHLPFILDSPSQNTLLPDTPPLTPSTENGSPPLVPSVTRHLSTGVQVGTEKLGSFQLSAKVSSLFHRALLLDQERNSQLGKIPLLSTFVDLDGEIRRATQTLLEQSLDWNLMLDCFAMLGSALFVLYMPYLPILERTTPSAIAESGELSTALAALRFACKMSTDISCKVNKDYVATGPAPRSPAALAAPAGTTCYFVVIAYVSLCRLFPDEYDAFQVAIAEKFESLWLFSFRWGIADKMIGQLERKTKLDRNHYLKHTLLTPPTRNTSYDIGRCP
ncbi:hypothetical protein F5X99DRAFT_408565 [Biscogniauxia marginata]|nr:hypothetical protein F5X99DRAFT_408565 [Biscogniauxia marginata]